MKHVTEADCQTTEAIYKCTKEELQFITGLTGMGIKKKGFRPGRIPLSLVNYYKGNDILNYLIEINQQKSKEELSKEGKELHYVKLLEQKVNEEGELQIKCQLYYTDTEAPEDSTDKPKKNLKNKSTEQEDSTDKPKTNNKSTEQEDSTDKPKKHTKSKPKPNK